MISTEIFFILIIVIGLYKLYYLGNEDRFRFKSYNKVDPYSNTRPQKKAKKEIVGNLLLMTFHKATQSIYSLVKIDENVFVIKQAKEEGVEDEIIKLESQTVNPNFYYLNLNITDEGLIEIVKFTYSEEKYYSFIKFDFNGKLIYKKNIISENPKTLLLKRPNGLIDLIYENRFYGDVILYYEETSKIEYFELLNNDIVVDIEQGKRVYMNSIAPTNIENQIACIVSNIDYDSYVDGIKIFNTNSGLKLIHDLDLDIDDGATFNLTFNSKGDKMVVLFYKFNDDIIDFEDNEEESEVDFGEDEDDNYNSIEHRTLRYGEPIKIIEYAIENQKISKKTINTDLEYYGNIIKKVHYITDRILCVISNYEIHLFDLEKGFLIEKIRRDNDSVFYVTFNCLLYVRDKEIKHFRLG